MKTKIYDKRDDFDFDIVNFPFLDGDVDLISEKQLLMTLILVIRF